MLKWDPSKYFPGTATYPCPEQTFFMFCNKGQGGLWDFVKFWIGKKIEGFILRWEGPVILLNVLNSWTYSMKKWLQYYSEDHKGEIKDLHEKPLKDQWMANPKL